jgi:hypothetical protein
VIKAQLADVHALKLDAEGRAWDAEAVRHGRVAASLEEHLRRVRQTGSTG